MKLQKLIAPIAAAAMLCMLATSATAGVFLPLDSTLKVNIGALPPIVLSGSYQHGGWATVSVNGSAIDMTDTSSIWNDTNVSVGTSLLTGVALITGLTLTAANGTGDFNAGFTATNPWGGNLSGASATAYSNTLCPGGCLGGLESMTGQFIVGILGSPLPFSLSVIGVGGVASLPVGQAAIVATGGPFITGKARLTNITTNVISIPTRGTAGVTGVGVTVEPNGTENVKTFTTQHGFVTSNPTGVLETEATVTLAGGTTGSPASGTGSVTLISPLRVQTGPLGVGNLPGQFVKTFVFVPEPGTVLLLVSGAAGLIFIGRKRMKG
jgi:hypothetical protein